MITEKVGIQMMLGTKTFSVYTNVFLLFMEVHRKGEGGLTSGKPSRMT